MRNPLLFIAFATFVAFGASDDARFNPDAPLQPRTVIAKVNGLDVTLADLQQKRADTLFQAKNAYYKAERKALDEVIDEDLLKDQARREKVTVDRLLDRHVKSTLPPDPSDEALRVYYEGVDTTQPYEAVKHDILEHIREHRLELARANYLKLLRSQAQVIVSLPPPRVGIDLTDTPILGPSTSRVTVIEFADYECPYCQQVTPELERLQAEYKGRLAFAYKDSPLPMHSHAEKAAEAAHCAGAQGKYWEYHDLLFSSKQLDIADLKADARKLNLDGAVFDKCLDSGEQARLVAKQLTEAQKLSLSGTPTFFINGRFLSGAVTYSTLREVVEQELSSGEIGPTTARR